MWGLIANFVSKPSIVDWLIERAMRTPYTHIYSLDGESVYMYRYWLFNPYRTGSEGRKTGWRNWLPSIRLHRIMLADQDRHLHDHPWDARTIILRGKYVEDRLLEGPIQSGPFTLSNIILNYLRVPGDTATVQFNEFHRITEVSPGGVWTLFITWKYQGTWGFLVNGKKIPHKEYWQRYVK